MPRGRYQTALRLGLARRHAEQHEQLVPGGTDPSNWKLAPFQASLQPYQSDLLLLNGVDYKFIKDGPHSETTGHACYPGMFTGALYKSAGSSTANDVAGGPSIDQFIGSQLKAGGYGGLVSLNQGAFVDSTARLSWSAAGQSVTPDFDPYHVFTTYIQGNIRLPHPWARPPQLRQRRWWTTRKPPRRASSTPSSGI